MLECGCLMKLGCCLYFKLNFTTHKFSEIGCTVLHLLLLSEIINFTIIITITRHQSCLDRPVSTPSNCLFKALPSHLVPSGLQFSTIFAILLPFILVACRCQFDLYLLSFLSTGSAFSYSKIYFFLLWLFF